MNFRWAIEELEEFDDVRFILAILIERKSNLNHYSPLSQRIKETMNRLERDEITRED